MDSFYPTGQFIAEETDATFSEAIAFPESAEFDEAKLIDFPDITSETNPGKVEALPDLSLVFTLDDSSDHSREIAPLHPPIQLRNQSLNLALHLPGQKNLHLPQLRSPQPAPSKARAVKLSYELQ